MKLGKGYSLAAIAKLLDSPFKGNENLEVSGINEIHRVELGDIVFVDHPKYYDKALNSAASVVLINKEVEVPEGKGIIICDDPFRNFNFILNYFNPFELSDEQQSKNSEIGEACKIHPSVVIGKNVKIGKNCIIFPNVSILNDVTIGDNVIIQSGTVIGSFGFYYKNRGDHFDRLNSCGSVMIENFVEIGANCTIDRGVTAVTTIGAGTKIDNLVQVGHDTIIGKKCLIAAQAGIAGCVNIEDEVTIWGQVGIASGITIGEKTVLYAQSGVGKSLKGNKSYLGSPVDESRAKFKEMAMMRQLPELFSKFKSA
ncbi:MAG: UDP-3-O-(3-hydroxymyristoyl)glucosamine N-acyltransferase [Flavobacteriales bacterium]|nr:UDP-3-O-(3-hydroxymyristoyl)glucosamine N-acyltransferase [Flavobacteriales bacterium]